jgi:rubrerythrin
VSIIETFTKLVDPARAREREEELRRQREQPKRAQSGEPPRFTCRVCGLVSEDTTYCPECLAETMVPLRDPR